MTRILALETAGETCSVAIMDGDEVLEYFEQAPRRQTERVLPMVEALLRLPRGWPLRRTCR